MMKKILIILIVTILTFNICSSVSAALKVDIINKCGVTITKVYLKESGTDNWKEYLDGDVIHNGDTYPLYFTSNTPPRYVDFYFFVQGGRGTGKYNFDIFNETSLTVLP